ncbi:isocitrate lyase/PEP mutase family protein [Kribbella deserti]|uniref:Isocitrate lyase/phosphoenolpyruvate mutase family protein n=1 Tax=Kribbella deserti TaxID=1926257 RepID=A0ABV6QKD3_9ACTN
MSELSQRFRALHHGPGPLILPNVWDAVSARAVAEAGYPAIATSSAAMARANGYDDGEQTPPVEMFAAIARIARVVDLPVTADIEAGYGLAPAELAERLLEAGAVGCNLEDSRPATGELVDPEQQAAYLADVRAAAGADLVINGRVDIFIAGSNDVEAAIARGRLYRRAGVDCVYPIAAPVDTIPLLVKGIGGPVNAHARANGPTAAELAALGAQRISFGASLHHEMTNAFRTLLANLQ